MHLQDQGSTATTWRLQRERLENQKPLFHWTVACAACGDNDAHAVFAPLARAHHRKSTISERVLHGSTFIRSSWGPAFIDSVLAKFCDSNNMIPYISTIYLYGLSATSVTESHEIAILYVYSQERPLIIVCHLHGVLFKRWLLLRGLLATVQLIIKGYLEIYFVTFFR